MGHKISFHFCRRFYIHKLLSCNRFSRFKFVFLPACCLTVTVAAAEADPQPVKGKPGEKVTLDFGDQKLKEADWVVWSRGPDSAVLAQYIDRDLFILSRRFQLDTETGSLTILDLRVNDTGTYQGQNLNGNTTRRRFHLTVDEPGRSPETSGPSAGRSHWPGVAAASLLVLIVAVLLGFSLRTNQLKGKDSIRAEMI
ncbi:uncharacterized protein LOC103472347 isoform X3 [Poecilia reticulata]|uniref:uncharacterized protein LOC103472347 isoform X3 n=1 Tax=Poecilia reticulata TaxID=8081 RepID=UPI0007EB98A7|nr:PREDICTED: uncharacterized protein LOC103472347 isoform X3 [Poecilia reticulata]